MEEIKIYYSWEYKSFGYFSLCSKENMFKQTLLKMYKNVKTIIILAHEYPISFSYLLSILSQHKNIEKVIIKAQRPSWIWFIWNIRSIDLIKMYQKHKINIKHKIEQDGPFGYDCIIIER